MAQGNVKQFPEDFPKFDGELDGGMRTLLSDHLDGSTSSLELNKVATFVADPILREMAVAIDNVQKVTIVVEGDQAQQDIDETLADIVSNYNYRVDIISTNGSIFKNDDISTKLMAIVFRGKLDVTDTLDASLFQWKRTSSSPASDIIWNQAHFGGSKSIQLTGEDVNHKATFSCEVTI